MIFLREVAWVVVLIFLLTTVVWSMVFLLGQALGTVVILALIVMALGWGVKHRRQR